MTVETIKQSSVFNAPIQKVWEAVATSEGIAEWFMPNDFKAELGHEFSLHSPYGISPCKVTELNPPNRLSFSWGKDWHVTFELKDLEGKTEFTLIHAGWDETKVTETGDTHADVRERMDHGWREAVLPRLKEYVEV
ncbi:SRPBCC family protein [Pseudalkalibacillus sp. R45]|uniref:SRPBCC family protein n=1 Tax=Bacillales TaxID=1385 RepID=UPI001C88D6CA|nr:SRPBCC domain-containing protein [Alkalihalobacillus sp. TS-13]